MSPLLIYFVVYINMILVALTLHPDIILAKVLLFLFSGTGGDLQNIPDMEKVTKIYCDIKRWGAVSLTRSSQI